MTMRKEKKTLDGKPLPEVNLFQGEKVHEAPDGSEIRYSVHGAGPCLIFCNGLGLDTCLWLPFAEALEADYRTVLWDYPGHGKSSLPNDYEALTIDRFCDLISGIMEQEGIERATLLGHSMGVQVIFQFLSRYPEKVDGLVPICGSYRNPAEYFGPMAVSPTVFDLLLPVLERYEETCDAAWQSLAATDLSRWIFRHVATNPRLTGAEAFLPYFYNLPTIHTRVFFQTLRNCMYFEPSTPLKEVNVPVLVVAGENDWVTPHLVARLMAREIPDAELFTVRRGSHLALLDSPETVILRVEKFLRERLSGD
jgi:pimeloyl-ACP methyl ester carboxylesterase